LLLIASFRSEDIQAKPFLRRLLQQTGTETCRELSVAPLAEHEAHDLAQRLIGLEASASEPFISSLVREARGNPFLLEQLTRYALTSDKAATTGITLAVMLEARLRQLPKGSRQFLSTLAVAARPVNPDVAYQAAGLKGDELRLIGALRAAQLLRSGGSNYGVELYHDRIRETLMALMEPGPIRQIHRRLGAPGFESMIERKRVLLHLRCPLPRQPTPRSAFDREAPPNVCLCRFAAENVVRQI